jgi:GNAT superfamily N-acetyltransferase
MPRPIDMNTTLRIDTLQAQDRAEWGQLALGYKRFYETEIPESEYDTAFARLIEGRDVHAGVARRDGRMVGLVHYLFHASTWASGVCYLQDLFVDPAVRGQGVGEALIEHVAAVARERGAARLYWLTQAHNARARALYDRVAQHKGFIRYDFPMG